MEQGILKASGIFPTFDSILQIYWSVKSIKPVIGKFEAFIVVVSLLAVMVTDCQA